ncbi:MAG: signal peptidase II [Ilumatobacteraceae bacterium]
MSDPVAASAQPTAATPGAPARRSGSLRVSALLGAVVGLADQLTKPWAVNRLSGGRDVDVVWTLRFHLTFNSGMAFSRGQGLGPVIGVVALVVVVGLVLTLRRDASRLSTVGTGLVIGGAIGNIIDRLFRGDAWLRGSVVDFIDFQWFPIFNIADIAVNVGGALLILGAVRGGSQEAAP